jgi:hypothetical protein
MNFVAIFYCWVYGTRFLATVTGEIMFRIQSMRKPVLLLCSKVFIASGLACLPFLQGKLGSQYRYFSISIAAALLTLDYPETWIRDVSTSETLEQNRSSTETWEQNTTLLFGTLELLVDTILPILFFWSVMFPLPGISLKVSFYMLFSVIVVVLVGNLQIPVAFLQVLLSVLRLCSLLGHHHHDYQSLPDGASPNLMPSIVVFYMLELCQGSSYVWWQPSLGSCPFPVADCLSVPLIHRRVGSKSCQLILATIRPTRHVQIRVFLHQRNFWASYS